MTSPFVTLKPTRRKDANHGGDFFKLFLRANTKCARPQIADRRIGIDKSIYMICVFIFVAVMLRIGAKTFFDWKAFVELCRYNSCSMVATSFSRRICQHCAIVSMLGKKRNSGLFKTAAQSLIWAQEAICSTAVFSFLPLGRLIRLLKKQEPITAAQNPCVIGSASVRLAL